MRMGVTFHEAADDLLADYLTNGKRTYQNTKRRVELHLEPVFGARRLASLTTADFRTYIVSRQSQGAANAQINRELAILKRMYSLALQAGKLHTRPYIPMLREDNVRKGFFEPEQFQALRRHLLVELRGVVTFAYLTGWRIPTGLPRSRSVAMSSPPYVASERPRFES